MLNPVALLPIPIVLFLIGLAAYAALRYADRLPIYPTWPKPPARHRLTTAIAADPHRRDVAAIVAERISTPAPKPVRKAREIAYDPLDHRIPLAEVERRMALYAAAEKTRELVAP